MEFKGTQGNLTLHEESFLNGSSGFYVQSVASKLEENMLFANAYGHTKEEAEANAKLIVRSLEMWEMLGDISGALAMKGDSDLLILIDEIDALREKATTI